MKRVANRAELMAMTGRPRIAPVRTEAPREPEKPQVDPNIMAIQAQVSDITRAVVELASAVHAQALARPIPEAPLPLPDFEATIVRDKDGLANKILITRVHLKG